MYTDRAFADCFSRVGLLRRAVPCRGLCGLPRSAPRRLRLPKQHHAVFTLAAPPRTHGRRAARSHLQSPHGRRRTAAAMRPVARDPRHVRRNRPNLGVEVVAETLHSTYTASPTRRWSPACSIRGPATRSEDAPRVTPQHARMSVRCSDPSGSSGGSSRQDVLSGSTGGPSAASRASCIGIATARLWTARPPRGSPDVRSGRQSTPYTADGRPPPGTCRRSGQGSGVALGGVAYSGALVARWRGTLRGRPAGAQPALPPAPRGRLPSPARRGSGATAAAKLPPRSDTRLAGSPAQRLLRRQQRRRPMRLGRRRPCSRRWCRPDREGGEKKNARCFP